MLYIARSYLHLSGQKHRNVTDGKTDRQPVAITAVCIASNADAL